MSYRLIIDPVADHPLTIETRGHGAPELVLDVPRWMNDAVRRIPGRYFDWGGRRWRAPLSVHAAIIVRELLEHPTAGLMPDVHVSDWLRGMTRWHGQAHVIEFDDGPRLAVSSLIGTPPASLTDHAQRWEEHQPEASENVDGSPDDAGASADEAAAGDPSEAAAEADDAHRDDAASTTADDASPAPEPVRDQFAELAPLPKPIVHVLPFDAAGVAVLDQVEGLTVDTVVMLASAELRIGRMPAAATLRVGRGEHKAVQMQLMPGWSGRLHAEFAALPEAIPLETSPSGGYRRGDAEIDPGTTIAIPADPSLLPALLALIERHPYLSVTTAAQDQLATLRVQHEERIETIELSAAEKASPLKRTKAGEPLRLGGTLQPFQHAGVRYILSRRRTFLADEQGLGKTVQALAALEADDAYPAVVVCPAGMKLTWQREAASWLPHRKIAVLHGRGATQWEDPATAGVGGRKSSNPWATPLDVSAFAHPEDADVVILNYEIVAAHHERLAERGPRAVVFDESHFCKEPTAKRTRAAMKLSKAVTADGLRLALTGTPVLNQPRELTAQLRLIDRLKDFGSGAELARRFRGPESHDRLHWHLRSKGFVRRLKIDVLPQLPAKRRVEVPLELADPAEYRLAEKDVIAWLRTQPLDLRELDAKIAAALRAEQLVRMNHLRRLAARGKLPGAIAWISSFLASGESLIVFAQHKEIQEAILARFPGALHILGNDSANARDEAIRRFQAGDPSPEHRSGLRAVDPDAPTADADRLIVCSMRAAGQGITLTRASNVAFLELDWTPAMHDQAEDRCHRIGQRDAVTAWYLLAPDTIDNDMSEILRQKREVIDAVVDGRAPVAEPVSLAVVRKLRARGGPEPEDPVEVAAGAASGSAEAPGS